MTNYDSSIAPATSVAASLSDLLAGTSELNAGDVTIVAVAEKSVEQTNFKANDGQRAHLGQIAAAAAPGLGGSASPRTAYGVLVPHGNEGNHLMGIRVDGRVWIQTSDRSGRVTSSVELAALEVDPSPRSEWSRINRMAEATLVSDALWEALVELANDPGNPERK